MAKDEKGADKQKTAKLVRNRLLDEDRFKQILDTLPQILSQNIVYIQVIPRGLKLEINRTILETKFPHILAHDLGQVVEFVSTYTHYVTSHSIDEFYASFNDEEKERVSQLIEILKVNKNAEHLIFRSLRRTNYIIGPMEAHMKYIKFVEEQPALVQAYDITIPFIDGQGEEINLRLEIDKIELENLITALTNLLESE
ncbi:MAG: hypothetical protein K9W43_08905 [Candidatus Thorarchaeota archaeon]|nr:hypothetical protein [Candidatus Thorarchaeota archaeon]